MRRGANRGIVLVAVLFAVAIMSVMVVAVTALTRSGIAAQGLEARRLATHLALRSGLESAKALILSTPAEQRAFLDGRPVTLELGGGVEAEVTIRDAAALADLNRSDLSLIDTLLRESLPAADAANVFARISDWRRKAEEKAQAEAPVPSTTPSPAAVPRDGQQPSGSAAPIVFLAVSQLLAMAQPEEGAALSSRFTVFNPTGLLNPIAAPDDVLLAVPGLTPDDLSTITAVRKARAPNAEQVLAPMFARLKPFLALKEPSVFEINVRLLAGPGIIAQSRAGSMVQVADKGPLPFRTLWVSGS